MPASAVFHSSCSRGLRRAIALLRKQPAPRPQAANGITLVGFKGFKCGCRFSCRRGAQEDTRMGVSPGGGAVQPG